jgi:hypothetical protein
MGRLRLRWGSEGIDCGGWDNYLGGVESVLVRLGTVRPLSR